MTGKLLVGNDVDNHIDDLCLKNPSEIYVIRKSVLQTEDAIPKEENTQAGWYIRFYML